MLSVISFLPSYERNFQFTDSIGNPQELFIPSRIKFWQWSRKKSFSSYVKWKNYPFAVIKSSINGVGLFTDNNITFNNGDFIGYAFFKINSRGNFRADYKESAISTFVNDSLSPNMNVHLIEEGIILYANQLISPLQELTVS